MWTGRTSPKWVPAEPIPDLIPLGVFSHDSADGRENVPIAFEGYPKLRGTASTWEDQIRLKTILTLSKKQMENKRTQFNKDKREVM